MQHACCVTVIQVIGYLEVYRKITWSRPDAGLVTCMCLCNLLLNGFIHSFQIGLIHEPVSNVYINDTQPCFLSKTAQQT